MPVAGAKRWDQPVHHAETAVIAGLPNPGGMTDHATALIQHKGDGCVTDPQAIPRIERPDSRGWERVREDLRVVLVREDSQI